MLILHDLFSSTRLLLKFSCDISVGSYAMLIHDTIM